jgi:poly(3-hydroxybutyrate) depolymerase
VIADYRPGAALESFRNGWIETPFKVSEAFGGITAMSAARKRTATVNGVTDRCKRGNIPDRHTRRDDQDNRDILDLMTLFGGHDWPGILPADQECPGYAPVTQA